MFHMLLAAPVLAVFGAMGAAVVAALGLLLGLGFFAVLLVRLLFHGLKWLLWLPLAVGGAVLIGTALNILDLSPKKIATANMIPAVLLPMAYMPLERFIGGLIG